MRKVLTQAPTVDPNPHTSDWLLALQKNPSPPLLNLYVSGLVVNNANYAPLSSALSSRHRLSGFQGGLEIFQELFENRATALAGTSTRERSDIPGCMETWDAGACGRGGFGAQRNLTSRYMKSRSMRLEGSHV